MNRAGYSAAFRYAEPSNPAGAAPGASCPAGVWAESIRITIVRQAIAETPMEIPTRLITHSFKFSLKDGRIIVRGSRVVNFAFVSTRFCLQCVTDLLIRIP